MHAPGRGGGRHGGRPVFTTSVRTICSSTLKQSWFQGLTSGYGRTCTSTFTYILVPVVEQNREKWLTVDYYYWYSAPYRDLYLAEFCRRPDFTVI